MYIQGSSKSTESGHPFGYLKASTNLLTVNLFVLPYNYPVLLPLLDELFKVGNFSLLYLLYPVLKTMSYLPTVSRSID